MRHTTATWLIASGADLKSVQFVMRHCNIKITLDRYGHLFLGTEADAVSRLRDVFANARKVVGNAEASVPTVTIFVTKPNVAGVVSLCFRRMAD
ncbi:MAG: tyrosine-type recombinase/integrase [Pirellula sp.]